MSRGMKFADDAEVKPNVGKGTGEVWTEPKSLIERET